MIVGKLKSGVETGSPGAGEEREDGVDAWSVPSRSGVGFDVGLKSPHPKINKRDAISHKNLLRFMILLLFIGDNFLRPVYKPHSVRGAGG